MNKDNPNITYDDVVKKDIPISIKDINNKIIQTEYVKMVSTRLGIDESAMLRELNKYSETVAPTAFQVPQKRKDVTNSSQFEFKAQKNLLSVFLSNSSSNNYQKLNELLPQDIIQDETLIIVKNKYFKYF